MDDDATVVGLQIAECYPNGYWGESKNGEYNFIMF